MIHPISVKSFNVTKMSDDKSNDAKNKLSNKFYRLFPSVRLLSCALVMLAAVCVNVTYASFNFTLICMVNASYVTIEKQGHQVVEQNCPSLVSNISAQHSSHIEVETSGDLPWTWAERSNVQAAYAYMMIVWSIPCGLLIHRFGAKRSLIVTQLLSAAASFLLPFAVYAGPAAAFAVRLLSGTAYGMCWPTIHYFVTHWSPSSNVGFLMTLGASGFPLGTIIAFMLSGETCALGMHGWQYAFYFAGSLSVLCSVLFVGIFTNDPTENRCISKAELDYILATRSVASQTKSSSTQQTNTQRTTIPWLKIMTSLPVYAIMSSSFYNGWSFYYVSTSLPTYLNEVMGFDVRSNGFLSALPNIAQFLGRLTFGVVSDRVDRRFNRTVSVKLFDAFALAVPGIMFVVISFQNCETASVAIIGFVIGHFFISANTAGYFKSVYFVAPRYVGIISALCGMAQALPAIIVPYVIGFITSDGTIDQWRYTQYLNAGLMAVGVLVFSALGSGEEQTWAKLDIISEGDTIEKGENLREKSNGSFHENNNYSCSDEQEEPQIRKFSLMAITKFTRLNSYGQAY